MSWNESRDCCNWDGVTCDLLTGYVIGLDLSCSRIRASINPNNSLFQLHHLQRLNLAYNDFYPSSIPNGIGRLRNLRYVDLEENNFQGFLKESFFLLPNLERLKLGGHIEQLHHPTLKYLDLKFNFLHGHLASSICKLMNLTLLDLSHKNFSESVPHCLGSMAGLGVLDLRKNNFNGSLPLLCGQSTLLMNIVLNGNRFEGPLPVSLLNYSSLEVLDMGINAINGTFPAWLGTLDELQLLVLKLNKFHGPISTKQKFFFPKLRIFDLLHNEFSGSLLQKFCKTSKQ
ncbi:receptor-like protein 33 [Lycium barbarum]|uniref:receptor-like protein 33 n=1 Tax=Lycium barbarum TaxID=112863 RepID=UPI00293F70CD|nr:receptor-like protein 33 [Lycium barbarum]